MKIIVIYERAYKYTSRAKLEVWRNQEGTENPSIRRSMCRGGVSEGQAVLPFGHVRISGLVRNVRKSGERSFREMPASQMHTLLFIYVGCEATEKASTSGLGSAAGGVTLLLTCTINLWRSSMGEHVEKPPLHGPQLIIQHGQISVKIGVSKKR